MRGQVNPKKDRVSAIHVYPFISGPNRCDWNPTTSFLTAATLIYAIGAGITAAAGTRLALQ